MVLFLIAMIAIAPLTLSGCDEDAKAANSTPQYSDKFDTIRRLTVINTKSNTIIYELTAVFYINLYETDTQLGITCKIGPDQYLRHNVGLNISTAYIIDDIGIADVDPYIHEVKILPEIIPPADITSQH
ncbi:MAG: hypothetical protein RSB76_01800 [Clostridia bacterium]